MCPFVRLKMGSDFSLRGAWASCDWDAWAEERLVEGVEVEFREGVEERMDRISECFEAGRRLASSRKASSVLMFRTERAANAESMMVVV